MDPKTLRTSLILLSLGLFAALASLGVEHYTLKRLAAKGKVPAGGPGVLEKVRALLPGAPKSCRDKVADCLKPAGKTLDAAAKLGDCYVACHNLGNPDCPDPLCGDRCEALFGVRESCP